MIANFDSSMIDSTPPIDYFFPAEWEKHRATWLTFPHNDHSWQGNKLAAMYPEYFAFIKAISFGEKVCLNVDREELLPFIQEKLDEFSINPHQIEYHIHPTNDAWCRDHGPAFLIDQDKKNKLIINWEYNAWGGKYPPFNQDNQLPMAIANYLGLKHYSPGLVMEGGSVEFNGEGTIITSKSCLLNKNRNPHLSQEQIELNLKKYYGAQQILWVEDGIVGDDTDGHIDDTVRFTNPNTVITMVEKNRLDDNHAVLEKNLKMLEKMRLKNGEALNIFPIQMPEPVVIDDFRAPGSYANFYIANHGVIVPIFNCKQDDAAIYLLEDLFKGKKIIPLSAEKIIWGQGSFHCLSQQEPEIL